MKTKQSVRFALGKIVATPGVTDALEATHESAAKFLERHQSGDWGDVGKEDWEENELSLRENFRLLSSYELHDGTKIWIITEWDRSVTTILLPSEY